jgi:hypothetical protein
MMVRTRKQLVEHQQSFIDQTKELLAEFESGHHQFHEQREGRTVDITSEWVKLMRDQITRAEALVATVKKLHPDEFV